ncbi:MAG: EamA family transporter RarD [Parvularculaceae bacterium]|nr:EamA family transporter RarD [Parvularculaceae bacterium]
MNRPPTPEDNANAAIRFGLACGVGTYLIWGLFPVYIKMLDGVAAMEIVAQRIVWAAPLGALLLSARGQWRETLIAVRSPRVLGLLLLSAFVIGANWLIYVWAVANDRVLEASLGYYINPLIFVAAGVFILKEQLTRAQIAAVAMAGVGVCILTIGAGVFPWPSLMLAFSFTVYGYIRKTTPVGAMPGLFIETMLLSPIALAYLFWMSRQGMLAFGGGDASLTLLLIAAGPMTVVPLLLFALSARRLRLSTVGFLQYIGPTGQLFLGLYYGEAFTIYHGICFSLIWAALALTTWDALRRNNAEKKAARAAIIQTVSATPKN